MPSPLTFQTPVAGNGPSFLRDEEGERERERERDKKRKSPEGDGGVQGEGVGETGLKRVKT